MNKSVERKGFAKACRFARGGRTVAVVVLATAILTAGASQAEVRVNGDASTVRVEAIRSNVAEILSVLGSTFKVRVKTSIVLDRTISGTFAGTLGQVLPRVLEGYNYVIKREDATIEIIVIGPGGELGAAVQPPEPRATQSLAAEWRGLTKKTAPQDR